MKPEIASSLKKTIPTYLGPHLDKCYWQELQFDGDQLELVVQEEEKSTSPVVVIRLTVSDDFKQIYISNIMMPMFLRRQGIGKGLIAKIYEVAKAFKYSLFLVQMTERFFDRMVKRGAVVIQEGDRVQITDQTNLKPDA